MLVSNTDSQTRLGNDPTWPQDAGRDPLRRVSCRYSVSRLGKAPGWPQVAGRVPLMGLKANSRPAHIRQTDEFKLGQSQGARSLTLLSCTCSSKVIPRGPNMQCLHCLPGVYYLVYAVLWYLVVTSWHTHYCGLRCFKIKVQTSKDN